VRTGKGEQTVEKLPSEWNIPVFDDLNHVVNQLLIEESS
jgi:hypothetical protein